MKPFLKILFIVSFVLVFSAHAYAADDQILQIERSKVGFNIFKNVCFMMSSESQKDNRISFLDSKFQRFESPQKEKFLEFSMSKKGDAWSAAFPKGVFVVIVEDNGNCHMLAQKADAKTLHEMTSDLYEEASKKLTTAHLKYHSSGNDAGSMESSGFDVNSPADKVLGTLVVSTPKNSEPNKPQAIMSYVVAGQ